MIRTMHARITPTLAPPAPLSTIFFSYMDITYVRTFSQAALEAADSSAPAERTPAKYLGGELRVKSDVGTTSVSMAFAAPPGSDGSEFRRRFVRACAPRVVVDVRKEYMSLFGFVGNFFIIIF